MRSARLLRNGAEIPVEQTETALLISLPPRPADLEDEIVVVELTG